MEDKKTLIEVKNLGKHFKIKGKKVLKAVDGVDLSIKKGETFGLVGESGCGKSTLGRTITRLYDVSKGSIIYEGEEITHLKGGALKAFQRKMQIIFQDPYSSLNPSMNVEEIISEPIKIHTDLKGDEVRKRVRDVLKKVGLPEGALEKFPHEFSGGQRQRIGIGRALSVNPDFILCDEPISALDVSIQAQVVNTLKDIQRDSGVTYLFVAHDLSMVRYISDRIGVMYLGNIVEVGKSEDIYSNPKHPYTKVLLESVPRIGKRLEISDIKEDNLNMERVEKGCSYRSRCKEKLSRCEDEKPSLNGEGHQIACHLYN